MIRNAAKGQNFMFRNLYAEVDGVEKDIVGDGMFGCARLTSSILYLNKLISDVHATVEGLEKDLIKSGWQEVSESKEGAVIIWEKELSSDGGMHSHSGFYLGNDEAVSNSSQNSGLPHIHHFTFNNTRKIEKIFWHPDLE